MKTFDETIINLNDYLNNHPTYVVLALSKTTYEQYINNLEYDVMCYRYSEKNVYADSATLFATDDNYVYYYYDIEDNETFIHWGLVDRDYTQIFSAEGLITNGQIFIWNGVNNKGYTEAAYNYEIELILK